MPQSLDERRDPIDLILHVRTRNGGRIIPPETLRVDRTHATMQLLQAQADAWWSTVRWEFEQPRQGVFPIGSPLWRLYSGTYTVDQSLHCHSTLDPQSSGMDVTLVWRGGLFSAPVIGDAEGETEEDAIIHHLNRYPDSSLAKIWIEHLSPTDLTCEPHIAIHFFIGRHPDGRSLWSQSIILPAETEWTLTDTSWTVRDTQGHVLMEWGDAWQQFVIHIATFAPILELPVSPEVATIDEETTSGSPVPSRSWNRGLRTVQWLGAGLVVFGLTHSSGFAFGMGVVGFATMGVGTALRILTGG